MAPEQISRPAEVDHRADIYALGVVFYQMLTGELPGKNLQAPSRKVSIDVRLDEIVLRAMEDDPELRYQQASVMKTKVETVAELEHVKNDSQEPPFAIPPQWLGYEYKSKRTFRGLPVLHVTSGIDPKTGLVRHSRGIVAIGGIATGWLAMGGRAYGGIAFGGIAVGGLAFGGIAAGLVSFGGMAIALIAALGGLAIAPVAIGGLALGYLAIGGQATGMQHMDARNYNPETLRQLYRSNQPQLFAVLGGIWLLALGSMAVIAAWARKQARVLKTSVEDPGTIEGHERTSKMDLETKTLILAILLAVPASFDFVPAFVGWPLRAIGLSIMGGWLLWNYIVVPYREGLRKGIGSDTLRVSISKRDTRRILPGHWASLLAMTLLFVSTLAMISGVRGILGDSEAVRVDMFVRADGTPNAMEDVERKIEAAIRPGGKSVSLHPMGLQTWRIAIHAENRQDADELRERILTGIRKAGQPQLVVDEIRASGSGMSLEPEELHHRMAWIKWGSYGIALGLCFAAFGHGFRRNGSRKWAGNLALVFFILALVGPIYLAALPGGVAFGWGFFALAILSAVILGIVGWASVAGRFVVLGTWAIVIVVIHSPIWGVTSNGIRWSGYHPFQYDQPKR